MLEWFDDADLLQEKIENLINSRLEFVDNLINNNILILPENLPYDIELVLVSLGFRFIKSIKFDIKQFQERDLKDAQAISAGYKWPDSYAFLVNQLVELTCIYKKFSEFKEYSIPEEYKISRDGQMIRVFKNEKLILWFHLNVGIVKIEWDSIVEFKEVEI